MDETSPRSKSPLKVYGKSFALILAMATGAFLPQLHRFSFLIQYLLMLMLFFAFLDLKFAPRNFQKNVLWILLANVSVAFAAYLLLAPFNTMIALAAFMTAIAPTAIAAPVMIGFVKGDVSYMMVAVLVTNISSAVIVPLVLPVLLGADVQISILEISQSVLVLMFVPLLLARLASRLPLKAQAFVHRGKLLSFPAWLVNLVLISANAFNFLRHENAHYTITLMVIALVSLIICIINFGIGALLGGRDRWQESSQALGQKNLSFVIWIALTFINPLVAMGPMFYILYHHLYNMWLFYRFEHQRIRV